MNIATSHTDSWLIHKQNIPQFQVFMVIYNKIIVFWDVISCGLVHRYQHFGGGKKKLLPPAAGEG